MKVMRLFLILFVWIFGMAAFPGGLHPVHAQKSLSLEEFGDPIPSTCGCNDLSNMRRRRILLRSLQPQVEGIGSPNSSKERDFCACTGCNPPGNAAIPKIQTKRITNNRITFISYNVPQSKRVTPVHPP